VAALMSRAELVVLRAGLTAGFVKELEMAVKLNQPKKLLILLPFELNNANGGLRPTTQVIATLWTWLIRFFMQMIFGRKSRYSPQDEFQEQVFLASYVFVAIGSPLP
jgi:hypothetical protein